MGSSHGEGHPIPWEKVGHPGWSQPPPQVKQKPWVGGAEEEGVRPDAKVPGR